MFVLFRVAPFIVCSQQVSGTTTRPSYLEQYAVSVLISERLDAHAHDVTSKNLKSDPPVKRSSRNIPSGLAASRIPLSVLADKRCRVGAIFFAQHPSALNARYSFDMVSFNTQSVFLPRYASAYRQN